MLATLGDLAPRQPRSEIHRGVKIDSLTPVAKTIKSISHFAIIKEYKNWLVGWRLDVIDV